MKIKHKKLDRAISTRAMRHLIAFAGEHQCFESHGRLKALLSDILPTHPIERDLLERAIEINGLVALISAQSEEILRMTAQAVYHELVSRYVSPAGAAFAAEVIATAVKLPLLKAGETPTEKQARAGFRIQVKPRQSDKDNKPKVDDTARVTAGETVVPNRPIPPRDTRPSGEARIRR